MSANNFKLTLDTVAPNAAAFTSPTTQALVKNNITAEFNTDGASYMKVWADDSNSTASVPSGLNWVPAASSYNVVFNADGNYYLHAIFMDDVGNTSAIKHSGPVRSDTVAPTIGATLYAYDLDNTSNHSYTNDLTFGIHIEAADSGTIQSGLREVTIACADFTSTVTINESSFNSTTHVYEGTLSFPQGTLDGNKTLTITAYDRSGNSATSQCTIYLDTSIATVTTTLKANASDQNDLIQYLNASNNGFVAIINTNDTDIIEYQLYGDIQNNETAVWHTWPQTTPATTSITISSLAFTTTDGTKTVNVKLKDAAGNISTANPVTRVYDATIPAVSISRSNEWIAAGYGTINSATISYTCSDATSGLASGSPAFSYKKGSEGEWRTLTEISGGSFSFGVAQIAQADKTPSAAGAYTIRIVATDNSGNTTSDSVIVNIEESFEIDSLALGGYEAYQYYYRAATENAITVTVNNSTAPGSGRANLQVWTNTTANDTTPANGANLIAWTNASQEVASSSIVKAFVADSATNFLHVKAISQVGNVAYKHIQFTVDHTAPEFNASIVTSVPTNSPSINISVSNISDNFNDGVDKMRITAASGTTFASGATNGWIAWANGTYTLELDSQLGSGTYGAIVEVKDKAGNIATQTLTWEYDDTPPLGTLVLRETDGTTAKISPTADKEFKVIITYNEDATDVYSHVQYKIWGDFALTDGGTQVTESNAVWTTLTAASITTDTLYCTANSGSNANGETKTIYGKLKDDAGNVTSLTSSSFIYNPNTAEITISNVSNERISCVHVLRKTVNEGTVSDLTTYADLMSFTVNSDQNLVEIKVAAYADEDFPTATTTGAQITTAALVAGQGSNGANYNATGNPITLPITVIIDGKDYRAALGGSDQVNVDGTHYVLVFGKNNAGLWSVAGTKFDAE